MSENERRYKVVYVGEEAMVTTMTCLTDHNAMTVSLPVFKGLPEGFQVISVHYEYSRRAFAIVIFHDSFPIVPPWETFVGIDAEMETQVFDMKLIRAWAKENPDG